jgi:hypothetical protein
MKKAEVKINSRFGRLIILEESASVNKVRTFKCKCDCGNECSRSIKALKKEGISSCGCYQKEFNNSPRLNQRGENHQEVGGRLYEIWLGMKKRCYNDKSRAFKWYGAKGIIICDEWKNRFLNFKSWAIENGYAENLTIDRIESTKNYEPSNCRWILQEEQNRNKSNNRKVIFEGKEICVSELARKVNKPYTTIISKLNKGYDLNEAIK